MATPAPTGANDTTGERAAGKRLIVMPVSVGIYSSARRTMRLMSFSEHPPWAEKLAVRAVRGLLRSAARLLLAGGRLSE
jgi:hypothetical protein